MLCNNIGVNAAGHLTFAGVDTVELANKYQTPLYLMDEDKIRANCRLYREAMSASFGEGSYPLYASKAASFKHMYEIMKEEGMAVDLVSAGEICTAAKAGFPMERSFFHGNNKTDFDIAYAMDCGVGHFVIDNLYELEAVNAEAARRGIRQKILLRLTPGIDPHTYEAVATGKVDSKFGIAIETGQAADFVRRALDLPALELLGYHCHVGSQVFDEDGTVYLDAADIFIDFSAEMNRLCGFMPAVLNLGGGFGVRYVESDPHIDIAKNIRIIADHIRSRCAGLQIPVPAILMEPGRSIVADAGMTLYSVGTVKEIPGYKNYVSIDGGMTDNPRYALYGSRYTVFAAGAAQAPADFPCDLVGRCCESGDVIQPGILLPRPERGDIIAVCTTGAYNYSMASNYNRYCRFPVIMVNGDNSYIAVKRETFADLVQNDL